MDVRIENLTKTFVGKKGVETTAVDKMTFTIPDGMKICLEELQLLIIWSLRLTSQSKPDMPSKL